MNRRDFIKKLLLLPAIFVAPDVLGRIIPEKLFPVGKSKNPVLNAKCQLNINGSGVVHYDSSSPFSGTKFPVGLARMPVNNLQDALKISANLRKITPSKFYKAQKAQI